MSPCLPWIIRALHRAPCEPYRPDSTETRQTNSPRHTVHQPGMINPKNTSDLEQALTIFQEIGNRQGESEVLNHQGDLLRHSGSPEPARVCHVQALHLAREVESPLDEARALAGIGRCAVATGVIDGIADMRCALEIFQRLGEAEGTESAAELDALN